MDRHGKKGRNEVEAGGGDDGETQRESTILRYDAEVITMP